MTSLNHANISFHFIFNWLFSFRVFVKVVTWWTGPIFVLFMQFYNDAKGDFTQSISFSSIQRDTWMQCLLQILTSLLELLAEVCHYAQICSVNTFLTQHLLVTIPQECALFPDSVQHWVAHCVLILVSGGP